MLRRDFIKGLFVLPMVVAVPCLIQNVEENPNKKAKELNTVEGSVTSGSINRIEEYSDVNTDQNLLLSVKHFNEPLELCDGDTLKVEWLFTCEQI